MPDHKPAVRFIFFTLLLDVIGFGLLIPVGPRLVQQLQGKTEAEAAVAVSLLAATYAAMQFIFAPILGSLSDRYGRRSVILISLLGSGLDYFAQALAPSLTLLFITRAINGVSGANMTACNAYIADVTPPEKRAGAFGIIGAAFGLGFIIGPLLGGFLGEYDIRLPFWVAGGLCILNWMYGLLVLPESLPATLRRPFSLMRSHPIAAFRHLFKYPIIIGLGFALFLLNVAQFGLHATWVLYTEHRYQWSTLQTGFSLTLVGIGAAIVQGGLARKIIPKLGEPRSILVGFGIGVLAFIGYGTATQGWMIYAMVLVASFGGIAGPACQAMITKATPANEQGEVQGGLTGLTSIAQVVGPLIGGNVFSHFVSEGRNLPGAPYYVSALLAAAGLVVAWMTMKSRRVRMDAAAGESH